MNKSMINFIGVVEDNDDPLRLGRLKVRIYGVHNESKSVTPTSMLPWSFIVMPITQPALNGVGYSPGNVQVGTTVTGYFADGEEKQVPVVFGCIPGLTDGDAGKNDINAEAREAKYPFNKAVHTVSGHVIEINDSPGNEYIHLKHKSGTDIRISPSGDITIDVVSSSTESVNGSKTISVSGSVNLNAGGSVSVQAGGSLNVVSGGDMTLTAGGPFTVLASKINLIDGSPDTDKF